MYAAARTYLSTGVALVGAGAIAMSPVAPPLPDVAEATSSVATSDLRLSALANPFVVYGQVVENTLENLGLLGERVIADPAPILAQILRNQWASAQTLGAALESAAESLATSFSPDNPFGVPALLGSAGENLAAGDLEGAIYDLWQVVITPLLGPAVTLIPAITEVIRQPVQNLLDVIDQTQLPITLFAIGALSPIYAGLVKAGGAFAQDLFDAVRTADLEGFANALITGPAAMINGFLNGDAVDAGFFSPGLGTISGLLNIRDAVAQALRGPAPTAGVAAIDSTATDSARTVSLSVEPVVAKSEQTTPPAEGAVAEGNSTDEEESSVEGTTDGTVDETTDEGAFDEPDAAPADDDEAALPEEPEEEETAPADEDEEAAPAEDDETATADPSEGSESEDDGSGDGAEATE
ncbi:hypothetical protein NIIDNTM18_31220 [Mycolicibacterium litorale]|uniref:PE-PGRS family protein n=1 Tax=Mycolicibacterium litorale TaxID=758802 RepID=A0A6S6P5A7_9MYCO|nr:hypothetical protein [Mycolicibacterium litorale]BCI53844.1 hypothetical protein NIIDNTM18_31220 [Mycolicibacterium litorale]